MLPGGSGVITGARYWFRYRFRPCSNPAPLIALRSGEMWRQGRCIKVLRPARCVTAMYSWHASFVLAAPPEEAPRTSAAVASVSYAVELPPVLPVVLLPDADEPEPADGLPVAAPDAPRLEPKSGLLPPGLEPPDVALADMA